MRGYDYKFNPNDLVFKLVKDDDGFINAYYDDIKVGYIQRLMTIKNFIHQLVSLKTFQKYHMLSIFVGILENIIIRVIMVMS